MLPTHSLDASLHLHLQPQPRMCSLPLQSTPTLASHRYLLSCFATPVYSYTPSLFLYSFSYFATLLSFLIPFHSTLTPIILRSPQLTIITVLLSCPSKHNYFLVWACDSKHRKCPVITLCRNTKHHMRDIFSLCGIRLSVRSEGHIRMHWVQESPMYNRLLITSEVTPVCVCFLRTLSETRRRLCMKSWGQGLLPEEYLEFRECRSRVRMPGSKELWRR